MSEQFANNALTTLSAEVSSPSATTIQVSSTTGFPLSAQFRIRIDDEILIVTDVSGAPDWIVLRGQEGTTATTHCAGSLVAHIITAGALTNLDASYIGTGVLPIARGGTNSGTALSNNRLMQSSGGGIIEGPALTNGQLLIGSTGAAPVAASISAGTNTTVTNGTGSIAVNCPTFGASGSGHSGGAVPDPGSTAGTAKFLREDASWATPTATVSDPFTVPGRLYETPDNPNLTGTQNDYSVANTAFLQVNTTGFTSLTGIANGVDGRVLQIVNTGSNLLALRHESSSSSAPNRITSDSGTDIVLSTGQGVILKYCGATGDTIASRWVVVSRANYNPNTGILSIQTGTITTTDNLDDNQLGAAPWCLLGINNVGANTAYYEVYATGVNTGGSVLVGSGTIASGAAMSFSSLIDWGSYVTPFTTFDVKFRSNTSGLSTDLDYVFTYFLQNG